MADIKMSQAANAYKSATQRGGLPTPELSSEKPAGPSFSDLVGSSLSQAKNTGYGTESISAKALANQADLGDLVTAVTNAELTLNTVVAIRDRVISAYQDIMKMPI